MKKILSIAVLLIALTGYSQSLSQKFNIKTYAKQQTDMIQSALNLDQATADKVYKLNYDKARAIHKRIILAEKQGQTQGKTLEQVIKEVEKEAERASGYQMFMKSVLGDKYDAFVSKFGNR